MQLITENIVLCAKKKLLSIFLDFLQKLKNLVKCAASKPSNCSSLGRMLIFMCCYQTAAVLCELDVELIGRAGPHSIPAPACCDQTDSRVTVNRCQINFYGIMNILRRHDTAGPTMAPNNKFWIHSVKWIHWRSTIKALPFCSKTNKKTFQTPSKIN